MNGLYIGAMGMMTQQHHINSHSNNIANSNTNGYKFDTVLSQVFEEKRGLRNDGGEREYIGHIQNKVVQQGTHINLKAGNYQTTNSGLDVALVDETPGETSFFVTEQDGGQYLTRNGGFQKNEEGFLKTYSGDYVLGEGGERIQIPVGVEVSVNESGEIRNTEDDTFISQIQVVSLQEEQRMYLNKVSEAKFSYDEENGGALGDSTAKIRNRTLESSNVDITKEMVELLQSQRMFQASQKTMIAFDKVYEKQANQLMS